MKVECRKEKLLQALLPASRISGKKLALPVLSCVLIEAKDSNLTVRSTNLDLGIEVSVPARIISPGSVAVPSEVVTSFVSNLKDGSMVVLELEGNNLIVVTETARTSIKAQNKEDFPIIPKVSSSDVFSISSSDLVRGLKAVWQSASVSSMKPELSSILVHAVDDFVVFAATDSFRLAEKKIKNKKSKQFPSLLIPHKNVIEIIRALEDFDGEVEVHVSNNQIALLFEGFYMVSRIVEGSFPDYKQIIPKEFATEVVVLKQDVISALKNANIFTDTFHQIKISIDPKKKGFSLTTKNNDVGESIQHLQAAIEGEPIDVNFNYKYIADALPSVESDSVVFGFNGGKPLVIRGVGDPAFTYLVMPMNK